MSEPAIETPPRAEHPFLRIEGVTKTFGDFVAVRDLTLDIHEGEFFSLLGGSGCGKSTLLRMLAGLEQPTHGRIWIDGQDVTDVPPYRRPVNMMFQSYALFPHLNVFDNVAFGLRQARVPGKDVTRRVEEALHLLELGGFSRRRPHQLSGGQRQRVALARALVREPRLLLLDEPLAALDKRLRERTALELSRIQRQVGITFVLVTHDQEEAMNLSTRIGVMRDGVIEQIGTPRDIYERPENRFVASFIGSVNLLQCVPDGSAAGALACPSLGATLALPAAAARASATGECWVAIRPERIHLATAPEQIAERNCVAGTIEAIVYLGAQSTCHVRIGDDVLLQVVVPAERRAGLPLARGERVWLSWSTESQVVLNA